MKYKKVRWELVPEIGESVTLEKRNWFHNFHMNQWLHKRAQNVKSQYLYYPEEKRLQMELKQIFRLLDYQNKGALSVASMFLLFKHFGYEVSPNDLRVIYSFVDRDCQLSMDEFKAFTEDSGSQKAFRDMMIKLQNTLNSDQYIPLSIGAMLSHIQYLVQREKQLKIIMGQGTIMQKYQAFQHLIVESDKKTLLDEAYTLYLKAQIEFHKMTKRKSSLELQHGSMRKSFSTINGLQPLLFRNMIMKDADELEELAKVLQMQSKLKIESGEDLQEIESVLSDVEEKDLKQLINEAKIEGKKQANKEIKQILTTPKSISLHTYHQKQLSQASQPTTLITSQNHLTTPRKNIKHSFTKSLLERQLKIQSNYYKQIQTQPNETNEFQQQYGNLTYRQLSQKLPTII